MFQGTAGRGRTGGSGAGIAARMWTSAPRRRITATARPPAPTHPAASTVTAPKGSPAAGSSVQVMWVKGQRLRVKCR